METPEAVDQQTDQAFSARGLAEERFGKLGAGALDFVPIVGDILAAEDVVKSAKAGDFLGTAVNTAALAVGLIPGVGDVAAKGLKKGLNAFRPVAKETDPAVVRNMETPNEVMAARNKETDLIDNFEDWVKKKEENVGAYRDETGIEIVKDTPELQQTSKNFYEIAEAGGDTAKAREEHVKAIFQYKPIRAFENVPLETSKKDIVYSLKPNQRKNGKFLDFTEADEKKYTKLAKNIPVKDDRGKFIKNTDPPDIKAAVIKPDDIVESRLDITAYERFNAWITTIKNITTPQGQIYGDALQLGNVKFTVKEKPTRAIQRGDTPKGPYATIKGSYKKASSKDLRKKAEDIIKNKDPEWTQIGFDPKRLTHFYAREAKNNINVGTLVEEADEVIQIGPLILAKNAKFNTGYTGINKGGYIKKFNKGGDTMEDQMNFAFMNEGGFLDGQPHVFNEGGVLADDGVEKDPVSGNEVPSGSMAEEVRDDIPAMLSEGEYVVPADVVRYHGIEKFEDLRNEAKVGLQRMEADGRIGGQPVEEQDELPFSIEELQVTEAYRGGIMGFQEGGDTGSYEEAFGESFTPNQRYGAMGTAQLGFQLRNFTNPKTGKTITIPFFNGKPMQYIPPDFTASDVAGSSGGGTGVYDDRDRQEDEAEAVRQRNLQSGIVMAEPSYKPPTSFEDFTAADWQRYNSQRRGVLSSITRKIPILGYFQGLNEKAARDFALEALRTGKNPETGTVLSQEEIKALNDVATAPLNKSLLESLQTVIDLQQPDFFELEQDRTISADPNMLPSATVAFNDAAQQAVTDAIQFTPADDTNTDTVAQKAFEILNKDPSADAIVPSATTKNKYSIFNLGNLIAPANAQEMTPEIRNLIASSSQYNGGILPVATGGVNRTRNYADRNINLSAEDIDNLATMAYAEASIDGEIGMGAVANSILNRWEIINNANLNAIGYDGSVIKANKAGIFGADGNSMSDILFAKDNNNVFQYSPAGDGRYNQIKQFLANNPAEKERAMNAVKLGLQPSLLKEKLETETDLPLWKTITILESTNFLNEDIATNPTKGLNNKADLLSHTFSTNGADFSLDTIKLPLAKPDAIDTLGTPETQPYAPSSDAVPFAALEQNRTIGEPLQVSDSVTDEILYTRGFTPEAKELDLKAQRNVITQQNLDAAENMDDSEFRNSLRNVDLTDMTTKQKFEPTFGAMNLPAQPDFQPSFVMDYGFGTTGSPDPVNVASTQDYKLYDFDRFKTAVSNSLNFFGFGDRETQPLDPSIGRLPANLPRGFQFNQPQLSNVPTTMSRASLAEQTQNLLQKPDVAGVSSIRTESPFVSPVEPTSLSAPFGAKKAPTIKTSPLTQPSSLADFEPMGERKVKDAKAFLEARKKKEEKETKPAETKTETKPAKQTKEQTVIARAEEDSKRREEQERSRDKFDDQGNFVQQSTDDFMRDVYAKNVASGYYESSPTYGERDPLGRYSYNEGGLASKPKKTKPKKRNVKKGLGGKMAT